MPEMTTFAQRLGSLLREHRGQRTQIEVADTAGISDSTYSDYERGNTMPSLQMLITLLDVLGIDASELLALLDGHDDEPDNGEVAA